MYLSRCISSTSDLQSEMDCENINFNFEKPAQYEAVRKALAHIFIDEPSFSGPVNDMAMIENQPGKAQDESQETKRCKQMARIEIKGLQ